MKKYTLLMRYAGMDMFSPLPIVLEGLSLYCGYLLLLKEEHGKVLNCIFCNIVVN